jgi:hypothetical protein
MPKPINPDEVGALAFGLAEEIPPGIHGRWHHHARHQLLYAASGALHLETARGRWLLPPQRAVGGAGPTKYSCMGAHSPRYAGLQPDYLGKLSAPASAMLGWDK